MVNKILEYTKNKKISNKMKCKVIDIPLYKCEIKMVFGDKAKKLEKDWEKETDGYGALTRDYLGVNGDILISFFSNKPKIETVAHEFFHAVEMIMNHIGHKRANTIDEPSAYLMGYLIKKYKELKI